MPAFVSKNFIHEMHSMSQGYFELILERVLPP
jgi:hypothetical protein